MSKIIDYDLINSEAVKGYINQGWQPYGSPIKVGETSTNYSIFQAMVKYEQEPENDIPQMLNRQQERNARKNKHTDYGVGA